MGALGVTVLTTMAQTECARSAVCYDLVGDMIKKPDPRRIPEMGKELGKMLLQAVIFGIGVELGKDVYGWVKGRGATASGDLPDPEDDHPDVGESPSD